MRNRQGEIATILMLGSLVVIGVTAVISSFTMKDKKTTSSRASAVACYDDQLKCGSTTDYCCYDPETHYCTPDKQCKSKTVIPPAPVVTGVQTQCSDNSPYEYYLCAGGKKYEDKECTKSITNATNWCKYGQNTAPIISPEPIETITPPPPLPKCTSGQYFVGTGGYDQETPEQICAAQNGVYVYNSQQGKVVDDAGNTHRWACCAISNSSPSSSCPKPGLGYACCVQDTRCSNNTEPRYQWYGCTGQVCSATKISTFGGPGHLVDCPNGVNQQNTESCESEITPLKPPGDDCTDYITESLSGGCRGKCEEGSECMASDDDESGEKRFCCLPPPPPSPPVVPPVDGEPDCPVVESKKMCDAIDRDDANNTYTFTSSNKQCCPNAIVSPPPGNDTCEGPITANDKCVGGESYAYYKSVDKDCGIYCYGYSENNCENTLENVKKAQCDDNVTLQEPNTDGETNGQISDEWLRRRCYVPSENTICTDTYSSEIIKDGVKYCCASKIPTPDPTKDVYTAMGPVNAYYNCRQVDQPANIGNCLSQCRDDEKCLMAGFGVFHGGARLYCCGSKD